MDDKYEGLFIAVTFIISLIIGGAVTRVFFNYPDIIPVLLHIFCAVTVAIIIWIGIIAIAIKLGIDDDPVNDSYDPRDF